MQFPRWWKSHLNSKKYSTCRIWPCHELKEEKIQIPQSLIILTSFPKMPYKICCIILCAFLSKENVINFSNCITRSGVCLSWGFQNIVYWRERQVSLSLWLEVWLYEWREDVVEVWGELLPFFDLINIDTIFQLYLSHCFPFYCIHAIIIAYS